MMFVAKDLGLKLFKFEAPATEEASEANIESVMEEIEVKSAKRNMDID